MKRIYYFDLWNTALQGQLTVFGSPDKSSWDLMFVSDSDWVHNHWQGDMTYIFLLSALQTLSGLLPLPYAHSTQFKYISQNSHAFFCKPSMHLGNDFKRNVQYWHKVLHQIPKKELLVHNMQAIKCWWLFLMKWHTNVFDSEFLFILWWNKIIINRSYNVSYKIIGIEIKRITNYLTQASLSWPCYAELWWCDMTTLLKYNWSL